MEAKHLRCFVVVATRSSLRSAARLLQTTVPAVGQCLGEMEDELGVELLERDHAQSRLTDAGRLFLAQAEKALAALPGANGAGIQAGEGDGSRSQENPPNVNHA